MAQKHKDKDKTKVLPVSTRGPVRIIGGESELKRAINALEGSEKAKAGRLYREFTNAFGKETARDMVSAMYAAAAKDDDPDKVVNVINNSFKSLYAILKDGSTKAKNNDDLDDLF